MHEGIDVDSNFECRACGNSEAPSFVLGLSDRWHRTNGRFDYLLCAECKTLNLSNSAVDTYVRTGLAYMNYYTHVGPTVWSQVAGFITARAARARRELSQLAGGLRPNVVLDYGCGRGDDMVALARVASVVGVEPDESAAEIARGRGLDVRASLDRVASSSVDLVIAKHVLEHVIEPTDALNELMRAVRPGGLIVVWTPNVKGLGRKVWGRWWRGYDAPRHVMICSPMGLATLAERAGFSDVFVTSTARHSGGMAASSLLAIAADVHIPTLVRYVLCRLVGAAFGCVARLAYRVLPDSGDELVLVVRSPSIVS